jgi:16S rRNA (uracil1498-N3)-methyltransferase
MTPIFYTSPDNIGGEILYLDGSEARHLREVMRMKKGEAIIVVDGAGNGYKCLIDKSSKNKIDCVIIARIRQFGEPIHFVTLAAGLSTGFKFDDVIQRGVELGVCRFVPLLTEKSKVKISDDRKMKTKLNRWRKVALASMKQTRRSLLPEILPALDIRDYLLNLGDEALNILFDASRAEMSVNDLKLDTGYREINILVGPESGFSPGEIEGARQHGCKITGMGKRILRAENASPVAIALIMNRLDELR